MPLTALALLWLLGAAPAGPEAWAGTYYRGDGLGVNDVLKLAPQAGFVSTGRGCLGPTSGLTGSVQARGDELELVPTEGETVTLRFVRWGRRRYLLKVDQLASFAQDVNQGREPRASRFGLYLLAEGDEKVPADGSPNLPAGSGVVPLVVGKVVDFKAKAQQQRLTFDVGEREGLHEATTLYVFVPGESMPLITRVDEVREHTATATVRAPPGRSLLGWRISTRGSPPR